MKKGLLIFIITNVILVTVFILSIYYVDDSNINGSNNNYNIIFKGESSEVAHTIYVLEKIKKHKKTYSYYVTSSYPDNYDSTLWIEKFIKKGKCKNKKELYSVIDKNRCTSYVKYHDSIYSIDEFKSIF